MTDNNSFVRDIRDIVEANPQIHEIKGEKYSSVNLHRIDTEHHVSQLCFNDLSSLVEIIKTEALAGPTRLFEPAEHASKKVNIIINDPWSVTVCTTLGEKNNREYPYGTNAEKSPFMFGQSYDFEKFVIALRSMFVDNEGRKYILDLLKQVGSYDDYSIDDNGVMQNIKASSGVHLNAGEKAINPIVRLMPYRTFREVQQPESDFLFRMLNDKRFALYEADGGVWKLEAKDNIRDYLAAALGEEIKNGTVVILG